MALAYLLTFSTYGTHHHGDERGSYLRRHGDLPPNSEIHARSVARMKDEPFFLMEGPRDVVLKAIRGVAQHRGWALRAVHVRTNHVHLVVRCPPEVKPKTAIATFKAYATRALREAGVTRSLVWAERGHCSFLWDERAVAAACEYVVEKQGEMMACYSVADAPG